MNSIRLSKRATTLALASVFSVGVAVVSSDEAYAAGSTPANLAVSAQVNANCTITTSAVAFGSYDPVSANAASALPGTGSVTIACTTGSAPSITLGRGLNAAGSHRKLKIVAGGASTRPPLAIRETLGFAAGRGGPDSRETGLACLSIDASETPRPGMPA